uniref:Endonuclease/exonuclease/phosphatase domain-containing protein n=1 Tax=Nelumbo nucifera TaxID=4432 RepID=A0A822YMJ4_NELNU|nr:TPA_asm: hypothetical protein HUJ06_011086 [Nelumbo nucifera]
MLLTPKATRGGLWLLWKDEDIAVHATSISNRCIHATIHLHPSQPQWTLSTIYGHPDARQRSQTWLELQNLANNINNAWMLMGDFNANLDPSEKQGGRPPNIHKMAAFRETINACNVMDLGFCGQKFTWASLLVELIESRATSNGKLRVINGLKSI